MKNLIILFLIVLAFSSCASVKYIQPEVSYKDMNILKEEAPKCDIYLDNQFYNFSEDACLEYEKCLKTQVNFYKGEIEVLHNKINELNNNIVN